MGEENVLQHNKSDYQSKILPLWGKEIVLWFGWIDIPKTILQSGIPVISIIVFFWLGGAIGDFVVSALFYGLSLIVGIILIPVGLFITYIRASKKLYDNEKTTQKQIENNKQRIETEKNEEIRVLQNQIRELKEQLEIKEVDANIEIQEFPQDESEKYLSLKIINHESDVDLLQCYGTLISLERVSPDFAPSLEDVFNPNNILLSWGGGSTNEYVTIHKDKGAKTLNIAKAEGDDAVLLFHGWESKIKVEGIYRITIKIDGYFGDLSKSFKSVTYGGYFEFESILLPPDTGFLVRVLPHSNVNLRFVKGAISNN